MPVRAPLTFLWLSSLSTDSVLEDTLFSPFFRGLGCFVNDRWGGTLGQNKGEVPFAEQRQPDWKYKPPQGEKILVGQQGAWTAHGSDSLTCDLAQEVQREVELRSHGGRGAGERQPCTRPQLHQV
jgi:hypothetical protein